ncbi:L-piperidine-6-carboxylate dehydrogenase [Sandaracinobacteroides hominis]|uniref:L-piperidine-6-carboxylate dehydrogenase n=1 Tax=Sandaracinobacteroides hominis TaxID=2780086 RepID=UPI0018F73B4D|nr:aldehyde dehydrogenase family protein [Sandaracinobacteroides hominis]
MPETASTEALTLLSGFGVPLAATGLAASSPIDGGLIGHVAPTADVGAAIARAEIAFRRWRSVPAPQRGELVRLLGEELRREKSALGRLVTIECGKILSEGEGEVQEMIDICDFAVGLSRQLYGLTIASERPGHRMMEQWHPLGPVAVISAFNFPVAVWCWNAALALVCGNPVIWKPSEKTPLTALAVQALFDRAHAKFAGAIPDLSQVIIGGPEAGNALVEDRRIALVSATGSTAMGRKVAPKLAERFARAILELGGNNALIVAPSADLTLAIPAIAFAAMGTAGQRCTTLRRLIVHESLMETLVPRLKAVWASAVVGDPREPGTLVGPLIDEAASEAMTAALAAAGEAGGTVHGGEPVNRAGSYRRPALVEMPAQTGPMLRETFAPILYIVPYVTLEDAIALNNDVSAGLSSAIFTRDMQEAELFVSATGSDCGIANVNIATSGAEIGGAFGGEKETGGGRESGSDSWRAYMRRTTNTLNYSNALPLAQGVRFDIEG